MEEHQKFGKEKRRGVERHVLDDIVAKPFYDAGGYQEPLVPT